MRNELRASLNDGETAHPRCEKQPAARVRLESLTYKKTAPSRSRLDVFFAILDFRSSVRLRHSGFSRPPFCRQLELVDENRKQGLPRINSLREAPAAVCFLPVEPFSNNGAAIRNQNTAVNWMAARMTIWRCAVPELWQHTSAFRGTNGGTKPLIARSTR